MRCAFCWTVNAGKAWLTNDMSQEENFLTRKLNGKNFAVTPYGKNAGNGTIIVALYDSENMNQLLKVKTFDLAKGEVPQDEFTTSGYVKAYWWSDLDVMTPLCDTIGEDLIIATD